MFKKSPCDTCPYRMPMDNGFWEEVGKAQKQITSEYSDASNEHCTKVERELFEGLEAHVDECPGYSKFRLNLESLIDADMIGKIEMTEGGGTRIVKAAERVCHNPFLESPEYAALVSQLTKKAAGEFDAQQAS